MHPAIPQAAFSFAVAAGLTIYVGLRREKSALHWHLLALLGSLLVWAGAVCFRYSATTQAGLMAAFDVMFVGVYLAPPLWLLLALRLARAPLLDQHRVVYPLVLLPAGLAYLSFATNDAHRLYAEEISLGAFLYGPLFWVFAAISYLWIGLGVFTYLRHARQMAANHERRRAVLLASAAIVPIAGNAVYLAGLFPWHYDPTAPFLAISVLLLFAAVFRYQLLETLPLVRRDVIDHLRDGVVIGSVEGLILDGNPSAARMLCRPVQELRGLTLWDAMADLTPAREHDDLRQRLRALEAESSGRPLELATAAGSLLEVSAAAVLGEDGEPAGRFFVLRDRTEERRFERFVRQSQKLESLGALVAGVAHEVNNPLAFVRSNLGQLQRLAGVAKRHLDRLDPEDAAELAELPGIVDETVDGIERIARLVDRMRRLSRMPSEEVDWVDLNAVVTDAVRLAELHRGASAPVDLRLARGLPRVRGSRERLGQVVLNLLLNAKQALAGRRGLITAETLLEDGQAEIRVTDDGPGIPPEIQERIFDPFFTTKSPGEGTGLGLAIAFDIVREHGGLIDLASRPGGGACFRVRLPLETSPAKG